MTSTAFLDLKQQASKLNETERRKLSAHLIRLGQQSPSWRRETAKRLDEMADGKKVRVADLQQHVKPR